MHELGAVQTWHPEIEQDQPRAPTQLNLLEGGQPILRTHDLMAFEGEHEHDHLAHVLVVVDDEDPPPVGHERLASGSSTRKVEPTPRSLSEEGPTPPSRLNPTDRLALAPGTSRIRSAPGPSTPTATRPAQGRTLLRE